MTTLRHIFITLTAIVALAAMGQSVYVQSTVTLVDAGGYFPQLSPDGTKLVYAPTDVVNLKILEMDSTGNRTTTIASKGYPGFDARFGPDGKVYYVTQERVRGNLIHRTGHCYDPATGQTTTVLPAQHGAVQAIPAGDGLVMLGERDRKVIGRVNKPFAYARGPRLYVVMPDGRERMTSPAGECPMYLWPSVSPSGRKVVFEAVGKGLYVTDLSGKVLARLGKFLMPCWINDDYLVAMRSSNNPDYRSYNIYLIKADGSSVRAITDGDRAIQPSVSGNKVVYTTNKGKIRVITLNIPAQQ